MLSVVALGVFMGKQMFKLIEAGSYSPNKPQSSIATSSVQILYTASPTVDLVPTPEVKPVETKSSIDIQDSSMYTSAVKDASDTHKNTSAPIFTPNGEKWFAYSLGNGVNVRNGPGISNKKLFKVAKGTKGTVIDKKNGWTLIKWDFNKQLGWVRDDLLIQGPADVLSSLVKKTGDVATIDANQINKATAKKMHEKNKVIVEVAKTAPVETTVKTYVEGDKLPKQAKIAADPFANVRSGPGTGYARLTKLPKGVVVGIKKVQREGKWLWFEISFNEGKKSGWTREDNLSF